VAGLFKGSPTLASSAMELIDSKRLPPLSGFVYQHARFSSDHKSIEIDVRPRRVRGQFIARTSWRIRPTRRTAL
jgi:hypothetical protein